VERSEKGPSAKETVIAATKAAQHSTSCVDNLEALDKILVLSSFSSFEFAFSAKN
jgi:hypothetical protein